jgi:branched-chain amino acid transport system substrate-binding protein
MITRRTLLKTSAATGLTIAAGGLAAPAIAQGAKIKLGYVSPQSGPLAAFAEADNFILSNFGATQAAANFEIIVKDSQSNPNRAAEVAKELIIDDEVDMILVASTPETTNPVATTAEAEGVPVISTVAPWQPWFIGQQGNPGAPDSWQPFDYAYHFFWGLEDVISVFTAMWGQLDTNKQVGGLFPNDGDGNAWGDPNVGFPPVLDKLGYGLVDPGRYQNLTDDFSAQINAFKQGNVEIVTGVRSRPISPPSGTRPSSRASIPRPRPSARRSCSRRPSRRWVTQATTSPRKSGGRRAIPSSPRSTGSAPVKWRLPTRRRPASSGPSRSALSMPCSSWRPT